MAKKKSGKRTSASPPIPENVSAYFRQIFQDNPKLLKAPSNDDVYRRWLDDHPGEDEVPTKVKQILSFVKSTLRKKRRKKRGRAETAPPAAEPLSAVAATATQDLESLEENIDECLMRAKTLDQEGLANVIGHLRLARNVVVWKQGP